MNIAPLADLFAREGLVQNTGSHQPFWIDAPENVWFVQSGTVDVFIVPLVAGELGPRAHFFRAEPGRLIFGLGQDASRASLRLQAVGSNGSQLYRLPSARLQQVSGQAQFHTPVCHALDQWVEMVYTNLSGGAFPRDCYRLDPNQEADLNPGESAQPAEGVIWVKHLSGKSRMAGLEELVIGATDGVIPLTPAVWFQADEPAKLSVSDTPAQLRAGSVWRALPQFDVWVLHWAKLKVGRAADVEGTRLQAKRHSQQQAIDTAVARLSEPLVTGAQSPDFLLARGNPLLAACQLVSQAMGLTIHPHALTPKALASKDALNRLAKAARLRLRRVVFSGEWWQQDNGPMLAYLQADNQPVALLPTSASSYTLVDPVQQNRQPVTAELAQSLNPVAYTFYRPFHESAPKVWEVFQFGLANTRADQQSILLMSLAAGLLGMAMPIAVGLVFDAVIPSADRLQLWFIAVALMVATFATVAFDFTRGIALLRVQTRSDASIQGAVWDRLLSLPAPFFSAYTSGDLAMRANGINAIQQILSGAVITSLLSGLFSIFSFGLLFYYSFRLAIVATGLVLLSIAATLLASWASLRLQRPLYDLQGKISGQVLQFVTGISKLRVAGAELQAFAVWAKGFGEQKKLDLKAGRIGNQMIVFSHTYPVLTSMCLFSVVAFWNEPGMSTGKFLAFNVAFTSFLYAGLSASEAVISILHTIPIYERARPILQTAPEISEMRADPGELSGALELSHVSFRYKADGPLVLHDLSLQISPGEFVAVVGPSGSGKSTLMRLLLGFEVPEAGGIRYNGLDLGGLDVQAVRRQIGVVLQNGKLMPGDIFENIVGSSLYTLEDAWEAARKAGLEEDIQEMPMGMHTVLGEGAGTLSGGQRQRLIIARALVAKPRILLFDEATSALDNRTQAIVSQSLEQLQATRIVIAHRLSTIINADRILVLVQGRLVQAGTYDSLVNAPGPFAELAKRQLA